MTDITTLDAYLTRYGNLLAGRVCVSLDPLHVPGRDPLHPLIGRLKRKPYPAQGHFITASVKALRRQKSLLNVGEMGVGKTLCGQAILHCHANGRPYRALVFCPGQLCRKWKREIEETIPHANVTIIRKCWDLLTYIKAPKYAVEWIIIGRDTAKLGPTWRVAYVPKFAAYEEQVKDDETGDTRKIRRSGTVPHCPKCGQPICETTKSGERGKMISTAALDKTKRACEYVDPETQRVCGEQLWQYTREINRFEPARFIHKKMKGHFDYLICDECFPGNTVILTPLGSCRIDAICPDDIVISRGGILRRVLRVIKKRLRQSLVRIQHETGVLICTPNHKIWVETRYVAACDLQPGDVLSHADHHEGMSDLPQRVSVLEARSPRICNVQPAVRRTASVGTGPRHEETSRTGRDLEMCGVRPRIYDCVSTSKEAAVLLVQMFRQGSLEVTRVKEKNTGFDANEVTCSAGRIVGSNAQVEFRSDYSGEGECQDARPLLLRREGRERPIDPATDRVIELPGGRLVYRALDSNGQPEMEIGYGRHCPPGIEDRCRSGRQLAQDAETEESRSSQDGDALRFGLDDDPRVELPSGVRIGRSVVVSVESCEESPEFVYDLEVEDSHCYFASGVLVSNCHEEKSATSAQGNAIGSLAAACKKAIGMTGTLIGGYSEHIRPLLFRLDPGSLIHEGFTWPDSMPFNEQYGRIETVITEKERSGNDNSMSRGRTSKNTAKYCRPGIMPTLFGNHLIGNAVFLGLSEMGGELPSLQEFVTGVPMDPMLSLAYADVEEKLKAAVKQMLAKKDKRLLGTMLQTLMGYPDHPYGWGEVGYRGQDGGFTCVVEPPNLAKDILYAKEKELVRICKQEYNLGRQVWVYVQLNGKRDVESRVRSILERAGLKTLVLKSSVPLAEREEWIDMHCANVDVVISHPKLVETGLDLFSRSFLGHNFCTLVFYETGFVLPTMRQASRRAWRLRQPKACKVFYLYYEATMQERAMALMGRKLAAAEALEGKFSSEGLIAMAGDDGLEMALAKSLASNIEESAARCWDSVVAVEEKRPVKAKKKQGRLLQEVIE